MNSDCGKIGEGDDPAEPRSRSLYSLRRLRRNFALPRWNSEPKFKPSAIADEMLANGSSPAGHDIVNELSVASLLHQPESGVALETLADAFVPFH